jgi:hypothetical protein
VSLGHGQDNKPIRILISNSSSTTILSKTGYNYYARGIGGTDWGRVKDENLGEEISPFNIRYIAIDVKCV